VRKLASSEQFACRERCQEEVTIFPFSPMVFAYRLPSRSREQECGFLDLDKAVVAIAVPITHRRREKKVKKAAQCKKPSILDCSSGFSGSYER